VAFGDQIFRQRVPRILLKMQERLLGSTEEGKVPPVLKFQVLLRTDSRDDGCQHLMKNT